MTYYIIYNKQPPQGNGKVWVSRKKVPQSLTSGFGFSEGGFKTKEDVIRRLNFMDVSSDRRPAGYGGQVINHVYKKDLKNLSDDDLAELYKIQVDEKKMRAIRQEFNRRSGEHREELKKQFSRRPGMTHLMKYNVNYKRKRKTKGSSQASWG